MAKEYSFVGLLATVLVVSGLAFAGNASAAPPVPKPVPGTTGPKVPTIVVEKPSDVPKASQAIRKASSSASGSVQVTVLSNISAKPMPKSERKRCWTDRDGFWNTAQTANGSLRNFWDERPSLICVSKKDGKQYRVACRNRVYSKPVFQVVKGVIVLINSFGQFKETIKKTATATAKDWCGSAKASAEAFATVSGRTRMEARGNARLLASVKAFLRAAVKASAQVSCGPQPVPPAVNFTTLAFVKKVWNASGQPTTVSGTFPVTIFVPGSTLRIGVPGTGEKVVLRDSAGNAFRFGANALVRACENEVVLANWIILVARCYEVTTSSSGGEIVFIFKNQARPTPPPPVTPQQPTPTPPCDKCGEQVPPTPVPTQGPLAPPTPPGQSSAPPGGNTSQCQDPNYTASCQSPPP